MMKVLDSRVLVQVDETASTQKIGTIEIPGNRDAEKATVVTVGPESAEHIKEGDQVLIYTGAGKEFTNEEDGKKYRVVTTNEIIVIL